MAPYGVPETWLCTRFPTSGPEVGGSNPPPATCPAAHRDTSRVKVRDPNHSFRLAVSRMNSTRCLLRPSLLQMDA